MYSPKHGFYTFAKLAAYTFAFTTRTRTPVLWGEEELGFMYAFIPYYCSIHFMQFGGYGVTNKPSMAELLWGWESLQAMLNQ